MTLYCNFDEKIVFRIYRSYDFTTVYKYVVEMMRHPWPFWLYIQINNFHGIKMC